MRGDFTGVGLLAGVLMMATCCAGCIGSGLEAVEPPGPTLNGTWKLNPAASDDPQKIIDHMRAEANAKIAHMMNQGPAPERPGRPGSPAGGDSSQQPDPFDAGTPGGHGPRPDPLRHSPMYHVLSTALARGDYLTVRASPDEFVLDYGGGFVRSFRPGARSVVSAEGGVGDQESGWDKRDYVISVRAQQGPNVVEHYSLSGDGKHLIEKLRIGPAELSQVNLTRVYDPTTEKAPHPVPSND
jgi:hypothetical protein